jgi:hypothetical protein
MNKTAVGIIFGTLLLLVGVVFLSGKTPLSAQVETEVGAKVLIVNDAMHDWGTIGIKNGDVEHEFEIKNEGTETLKLYNISTSCMCTSAQLFQTDDKSPVFGMHDSSNYTMEVEPGENATVKVVFDPMAHGPSGVGPITRQVTVMTNDPDNKKITFTLKALVVKNR